MTSLTPGALMQSLSPSTQMTYISPGSLMTSFSPGALIPLPLFCNKFGSLEKLAAVN